MNILRSWIFDVDNLGTSDFVFIKSQFAHKKIIISLPDETLEDMSANEIQRLTKGHGYVLGHEGNLYTITGADDRKGKPGTGNALEDPGKIE